MSVPQSDIYMDYQASCPVDPRVSDLVDSVNRGHPGNPSSQHGFGQSHRSLIEEGRRKVANLLGAQPREIVFTSGATESNNLAIFGTTGTESSQPRVVTSEIEHPAVLNAVRELEARGCQVSRIPVDESGVLDMKALRAALEPGADLVSIMAVNNEVGSINPIGEIAQLAHLSGALFHTDATQAMGFVDIDVDDLGIDLLSLSGHKMYATQGIGALFVREGIQSSMSPQLFGGGQERGLRSGTMNTPGCAAIGLASEIVTEEGRQDSARILKLRDRLASELGSSVSGMRVNGPTFENRHPGNLHVTFEGADGEAVMANCSRVAMAQGSACSSAAPAPSHVLTAMGMDPVDAECSLRLSVGRFTTEREVTDAVVEITIAVNRVRNLTAHGASPEEMVTR